MRGTNLNIDHATQSVALSRRWERLITELQQLQPDWAEAEALAQAMDAHAAPGAQLSGAEFWRVATRFLRALAADRELREIARTKNGDVTAARTRLLVEAFRILEANALLGQRPWEGILQEGLTRLGWARPDESTDVLVDPRDGRTVLEHPTQEMRMSGQPLVFLGPVASANTLLKDAAKRDALREQFGVKAAEMEGSGVADATWNHGVGYLVVRAICDYCDMNKNDIWQRYATVAAAAYVRAVLEAMPGNPASQPQ